MQETQQPLAFLPYVNHCACVFAVGIVSFSVSPVFLYFHAEVYLAFLLSIPGLFVGNYSRDIKKGLVLTVKE